MWSRMARGWGPPRMRMPHSRLDSMARLVRFALPTSATWLSTTMNFACKDAPGGRDLQASASEVRRGPGKACPAPCKTDCPGGVQPAA